MTHQEIVLGGRGQAFYLEPIARPRRPVSVVVTHYAGAWHAATLDCELDPFETTLAEAAPAGSTSLRLKTTDGIVIGARYVVARHGVVVTAVDGDRVTLRRPFALPLDASEPFLGCRITARVDPAWAANVANLTEHLDVEAGYLLEWTYYTQAGTQTTARTTADLVRTPQLARVTPEDVDGRFPGWLALVSRPEDVIAEAFDIVRRDARLHRSIRRARHAFALRELAILAAHVIATEAAVLFGDTPHARLVEAEKRYHARLTELVAAANEPPPPPKPALSWKSQVEDPVARYSVAHATVIESMKEWIARNPLDSWDRVRELSKQWLARLQTPDERKVGAKVLRSLQLPKKVRQRVLDLAEKLDRD